MTPTIGRIVHFTLPGSTPNEPKVRPAIVTRVTEGASHVDLEVMLTADDAKDLRPNEVQQLKLRSSVNQGKGYPAIGGEWQWPPPRETPVAPAIDPMTLTGLNSVVAGTEPVKGGEVPIGSMIDEAGKLSPLPDAKPTAPPPADPPSVKPTGKRR